MNVCDPGHSTTPCTIGAIRYQRVIIDSNKIHVALFCLTCDDGSNIENQDETMRQSNRYFEARKSEKPTKCPKSVQVREDKDKIERREYEKRVATIIQR